MSNPKEKGTLQDYWKIPFRGLVPGGLNDQKDNPALPKITNPQDATVMVDGELNDTVCVGDIPFVDPAIPVVVIDDVSHISGTVRKYIHSFQIQVGEVQTVQVLGQDTSRRRALIRNVGPGNVTLGSTESVGLTGYTLPQITTQAPLEIFTTEEVWALQETGQSSTAILHVLVEFDKQN